MSCGRWRRTRPRTLSDLADRCRQAGITIEEISAGATPPARFSMQQEGFTEYRPGNYVYFDRTQVALGAATFDDCALTVLATVVSKPAADRMIFDSGSKTLTNDGARGFTPAPGFGTVVGHDNLLIERLSEEHATVKVTNGSTPLEPGDRVRIIPESLVRGVEPRRSGVACGRPGRRADADRRARQDQRAGTLSRAFSARRRIQILLAAIHAAASLARSTMRKYDRRDASRR